MQASSCLSSDMLAPAEYRMLHNVPEYHGNDKGDDGDQVQEIDSVACIGGA